MLMTKSPQEWLKQADYDINTADIMFDNKRYFYADIVGTRCSVSLHRHIGITV